MIDVVNNSTSFLSRDRALKPVTIFNYFYHQARDALIVMLDEALIASSMQDAFRTWAYKKYLTSKTSRSSSPVSLSDQCIEYGYEFSDFSVCRMVVSWWTVLTLQLNSYFMKMLKIVPRSFEFSIKTLSAWIVISWVAQD